MGTQRTWKTKTLHNYAVIGAILFIAICCGGCGGGGGGGGTASVDSGVAVIAEISSSGGIVKHPDGFFIEFKTDDVSETISISISKVALPSALPDQIQAVSDTFQVDMDKTSLMNPVTIAFELSDAQNQQDAGTLGIYRWDGEGWYNVGGHKEDGVMSTQVRHFSAFVLGTGPSLHKVVEFENNGTYDACVSVADYELAHPDMDSPIDRNFSVIVWSLGHDNSGHQGMWLPQGSFQFCTQWWDNTTYKNYHRFLGDSPPDPWNYTLSETTGTTIIPFDTSTNKMEGLCPPPFNTAYGESRRYADCEDGQGFLGDWVFFIEGAEEGGWHYYVELKDDCTLAWTSYVMWAYNNSGIGQWGYDGATNELWWILTSIVSGGTVTPIDSTHMHVNDPDLKDGKVWEWRRD